MHEQLSAVHSTAQNLRMTQHVVFVTVRFNAARCLPNTFSRPFLTILTMLDLCHSCHAAAAWGSNSQSRVARQQVPHQIYKDANGVEHVRVRREGSLRRESWVRCQERHGYAWGSEQQAFLSPLLLTFKNLNSQCWGPTCFLALHYGRRKTL